MIPVVAIVGRPNVGKSTLFNRLVGQRMALVDDRPGVTRDRLYGEAEWGGRKIALVDTGGFEPDPNSLEEGDLFHTVRTQAEVAVSEADVVLFVVDRQAGLTPADRMTAAILRRALGSEGASRLVLCVNKCDGPKHDDDAAEFWELGMPEMLCISAEHDRGTYDLWLAMTERLPPAEEIVEEDEDEIRIAVIGRPNIGKSTLVNRMIGQERHVVHDMPGTTMDSVDSVFTHEGQKYRIVDTAGIRRKAKINDSLEIYAVLRAIKTIERCHITILMVDATEGISKQDARLASLVADRGRGCLLLMNKWDEVKLDPERNSAVVADEIETHLPHLTWAPVLFISALTGKGCHRILDRIHSIFESFDSRVPTSQLNRFLEQAVFANSPPQKHHHPVRLNYMTQARVRPPTFIIWTNSPDAVKAPYRRYLENRLRNAYGFDGTPVRIWIRKKRKPGEPKSEV
jgi:GTP-binding protein